MAGADVVGLDMLASHPEWIHRCLMCGGAEDVQSFVAWCLSHLLRTTARKCNLACVLEGVADADAPCVTVLKAVDHLVRLLHCCSEDVTLDSSELVKVRRDVFWFARSVVTASNQRLHWR